MRSKNRTLLFHASHHVKLLSRRVLTKRRCSSRCGQTGESALSPGFIGQTRSTACGLISRRDLAWLRERPQNTCDSLGHTKIRIPSLVPLPASGYVRDLRGIVGIFTSDEALDVITTMDFDLGCLQAFKMSREVNWHLERRL